jgi:hypothetical protein
MSRRISAAHLGLIPMLVGPAALAHGGGEHVMGTVKAVEASSITADTKDHREVSVEVDASTDLEKSGHKSSFQDVEPGERVAIHAKRGAADGRLKAEHVKFGRATPRAQAAEPVSQGAP